MSNPHKRIPYESEERLQDRDQQNQISQILGLDTDSLTNVEPQPIPPSGGAGRVKKFRQETPQQASGVRNHGIDAETASNPPHHGQQHGHPRGYPALANFIGSDRDFFVFRRFDILAARNLLYLQDELMEMEEKLRAIDLTELRAGTQRALWNLHSRRGDANQDRRMLMSEIGNRLKAYQDALHAQALMLSLEKAPDIVVDSVANWIDGVKPVVEVESHFLEIELICAVFRENTHPRSYSRSTSRRIGIAFSLRSTLQLLQDRVEFLLTELIGPAIKQAARLILTLLAALFSVIPLPILNSVHSRKAKLPIIAVFAFGFATMLSVLTKSRTYEIFAAMAAYAAFLVAFVGSC